MPVEFIPMRWPSVWRDPFCVDILKGTRINYLLIDPGLQSVRERAQALSLTTGELDSAPKGAVIVEGEWPGVKLSESGATDQASEGPTGAPWVDSNGWRVRLAAAQSAGTSIWVDAPPKAARLRPESYVMAVADSASYGGRWIVSLDDALANGIAAQNATALGAWKKISGAVAFFAGHTDWFGYQPEAVLGIISDFTAKNEFLSHELLNLVARTNQQYRVIPKTGMTSASLANLRAAIYSDAEAPEPAVRKLILSFVEAGGLLITGPEWGSLPGQEASSRSHPRYGFRVLGKGRVAVADGPLQGQDPFLIAQDSMILISHRFDLLRFWNPGAIGSYLTVSPDRKTAVLHLLFYATAREGPSSVRVVGRYRKATLSTLDQPAARPVEMVIQNGAVEIHLPAISQYGAVRLEA